MSSVRRVGDLEVDQDLDFQRRQWRVQRIAWVTMAAIVLVALLGLFGTGPLSDASAEHGSLRLDYGRFDRKRAPAVLRVDVAAGAAPEGQLRLWLDETYLDGIEIRSIVPEPESAEAGADRTVYVFRVGDASQPATISFEIEHAAFGRKTGRLGLVDGPAVAFSQFVYP